MKAPLARSRVARRFDVGGINSLISSLGYPYSPVKRTGGRRSEIRGVFSVSSRMSRPFILLVKTRPPRGPRCTALSDLAARCVHPLNPP